MGPIAFVTATTGRNVKAAIDTTQRLFVPGRVPTALNTIIHAATKQHAHLLIAEAGPYESLCDTGGYRPPTIVLSTSSPESLTAKTIPLSSLRKNAPFTEVPIKIIVRNHKARE